MRNKGVAHAWAHKEMKSGIGSNLFFEEDRIYSYGSHFIIAQRVENKNGDVLYLFNDEYYSSATAKHQRYVYDAIPEAGKIIITNNIRKHCHGNKSLVIDKLDNIITSINKYRRSFDDSICDYIRNEWGQINKYINFFKIKGFSKVSSFKKENDEDEITWTPKDRKYVFDVLRNNGIISFDNGTERTLVSHFLGEDVYNKYLQRIRRIRKRKEEEREIKKEWEKLSFKDKIERWRNHEIKDIFFKDIFSLSYLQDIKGRENAWLRLSKEKDKIETSKGIYITVEEGMRLWKLLSVIKNRNTLSLPDSANIVVCTYSGSRYKLESFNGEIFKIGCHSISYKEMENMAKQLNLI